MNAPPHGQYAKGRQRREELLDIALEVFAEEGYQGTSIRSIAQRAGITVAGLLYHFGSREQLLADVVLYRDLVRARSTHDDSSWAALVEAMSRNATAPGLTELFVTLTAAARHPEHPAREILQERYRRLEERAAEVIDRDRDTFGIDASVDAHRLARLIIAIADGAQMQWLVEDAHPLEEPLQTFWTEILRQPAAPDEPPGRDAAAPEGGPEWERRVAEAWADAELGDDERVERMRALAAEAPHPALGAFEVAGALDSAGREAEADERYAAATALGLGEVDPARAAQLAVQHASTLRNLGRVDEAIAMLRAAPRHPSTGAAPDVFLALALHSAGRPDDALRVAIDAIEPGLPRYRRSVRGYSAELGRDER